MRRTMPRQAAGVNRLPTLLHFPSLGVAFALQSVDRSFAPSLFCGARWEKVRIVIFY